MKILRWLAICAIAAAGGPVCAQQTFKDAVKDINVRIDPPNAQPGQTVTWILSFSVADGWHTYTSVQPPGENDRSVTKIAFPPPTESGDLIFVGDVVEPEAKLEMINGGPVNVVYRRATYKRSAVVSPKAQPGKINVKVPTKILVCLEQNCLPPEKITTEASLNVAGAPMPVEEKYKAEVDAALNPPAPKPVEGPKGPPERSVPVVVPPAAGEGRPIAAPAASVEEHKANLDALRQQLKEFNKPTNRAAGGGLLAFLATAAFWGLVSLITPCVFPMIPITVSFFLKQSESEHHKPIRMALVYCLTIILVLGVAALTLLTVFRELSVAPATNILLALLFLVFALSLFGLYDITLPQSLTSFTAAREGRGGLYGTIFMALTFTIVSFTCVAPFLGGFAGMQASGQYSKFELALGALAFSTTFAAPFFVLALFPSLLKKLPKSGTWLNSVKVVMGFLELAAALKFLRTAELRLQPVPTYFTYDFVLGIWIALALICGLYLLNLFRLGHDSPQEHIGVGRMLLGAGFLALAIYLVPALFKQGKGENQRPGGVAYAWIDAFLLPEPGEDDMPWSANLRATVDEARRELEKTGKRQFVFLDNTGVTCTNCKYNERNVFRGEIKKLMLDRYWLVQHYTDEVPAKFYGDGVSDSRREEEADLNKEFQKNIFGTEQLPLYVALEVTKDAVVVRDVYTEGKINNVSGFRKFLTESTK